MRNTTIGDTFNKECQIAGDIAALRGADFEFIERDLNHYTNIIEESIRISDGMYNYTNGHFINITSRIKEKSDIVFNGSLIEQLWQGTKFFDKEVKVFKKKFKLPILDNNKKEDMITRILKNFPKKVKAGKDIFVENINSERILKKSLEKKLVENFGYSNLDSQEAIDYLAFDAYRKYSSHLNQLCLNEELIYRTAYDNNLIDLLLKVPIQYRNEGRLLKLIIQSLDSNMADIPLADSGKHLKYNQYIHWFYNYFNAFKKKFRKSKVQDSSWPNYSNLIRNNKAIQKRLENILNDNKILEDKVFNKSTLWNKYNNHMNSTENNERILFLLLIFGEWRRSMIDYVEN